MQPDEIYAYRLGSTAETLGLSRMLSVEEREGAFTKPDQATINFLDELTEKLRDYRPDILDAFMLGRQAARLIVVSKTALILSDYGSEWQNLWDATKKAILHHASRVNISPRTVIDWMNKVRYEPNRWADTEGTEALISFSP